MSRVTNLIITASAGEDEGQITEHLNSTLLQTDADSPFRDLSHFPDAFAGHKMLECFIFVAALNHVGLDQIRSSLRQCNWAYPEKVRVYVLEEDQEPNCFKMLSWLQ